MVEQGETPKKARMLSVVFSFRNEEETIPELLRRVRAVVNGQKEKGAVQNYELIFVNDASTDRSLELLLDESRKENDIKIINMSRRFGVSPCVMAGLEASSGDIVVYMDADLQDPPEVIADLVEIWRMQNVDVVHTVRASRKGESRIKLWLTDLGYHILNKTASIPLPVEAGDFKLLSRRVVNHLIGLKEKRPFTRGLVCWVGFNQTAFKYDREARAAGQSKFSIISRDVINNFLDSALISFSSAPLKLAILLGFLALVVDAGLVIHVLHQKLIGAAIPGWSALMMTTVFIGGVQLFCLGVLGLYINSIFEETKRRPNYIIESTHGFETPEL